MKAPIQSNTIGTNGLTFKPSCYGSVSIAPGEALGRENKPEFSAWLARQQDRECSLPHAEQAKIAFSFHVTRPAQR